ncbi:MAG: four helix bundle protein [Deltaproteobacteria bacterium]|nr:four helix bundle protein [Deltaproteobacteria bacterium]
MNPTPTGPRFRVYDLALDALRLARASITRIHATNRDLADQLQRAASSVVLNLAEGAQRRGRDRAHSYRIAAGSAAESRACLDAAEALGYVSAADAAELWRRFDAVVAMLWPLTR